ncbi:coproporphyrinogen III oxidase, partial [Neisseria sp. P0018.S006]
MQNQICAALKQKDNETKPAHEAQTRKPNTNKTHTPKNNTAPKQTNTNPPHTKKTKTPTPTTTHHPKPTNTTPKTTNPPPTTHPKNPHIPTNHANIHSLTTYPENAEPVRWFDGGLDLTPFYPFEKDTVHRHTVTRDIRAPFRKSVYPEFKQWRDKYPYSKHRNKTHNANNPSPNN